MSQASRSAEFANGTDARTVVRRLPGGQVELRHLQYADGLGWYGTQRMLLEPAAAAALGEALSALPSDGETGGKVTYLPERRSEVVR